MMTIKKNQKGFTLIELMIVVAIIGILAAVAIPNFLEYRNKSKIAAAVETGGQIRAALAGFAADSVGNTYPRDAEMVGYDLQRMVINDNGGTLDPVPLVHGIATTPAPSYTEIVEGGIAADYSMWFAVAGIETDKVGYQILMNSFGIFKTSAQP
jgi:prepilin-type N-terminal cleavage/methylation domain-containing protein